MPAYMIPMDQAQMKWSNYGHYIRKEVPHYGIGVISGVKTMSSLISQYNHDGATMVYHVESPFKYELHANKYL